ncbi:MAG: DNA translocase FtsK [Candidatus Omnitrophica bacterium]|nr:DNA translocase FtsK [Candidatus Omnitrophota bacterium]
MKEEHLNEIQGITVFALGLILLASLISFTPNDLSWYTSQPNYPTANLIQIVGAYTAGVLFFIFGFSAYSLSVILFFWSWNKFISRDIQLTFSKFLSMVVLVCVVSALFGMPAAEMGVRFERSGVIGFVTSDFLIRYLGYTGAYIILLTMGVLTTILTAEVLISPLFFKLSESLGGKIQEWKEEAQEGLAELRSPKKRESRENLRDTLKAKSFPKIRSTVFGEGAEDKNAFFEKNPVEVKEPTTPRIRITEKPVEKVVEKSPSTAEVKTASEQYRLPTLDLLADPPQVSASKLQSDLAHGAQTLEATLADFNVRARVADIERGPVITRYELEPAPGVKIQRITTLSDDIALAMCAPAVRIVAPIPGKNRVGIEVPNTAKASVYLKDVLSQVLNGRIPMPDSKLMLAIGKDISGKPLVADLADMPHLLIAGTTGSGKTVCVNGIIMSLLFNATPDEVKFLMVDPKMVELTQYNDIPHMLCPTVTDHKKVAGALGWVVSEMEHRYTTLSKAGVRNIKGYHAKGNKLPYIIIVIDELADLMQVSAKTIESAITRLAQLSRAVGIHLILATQRPSVDVITGVIKANFPARISFKVASKVDSRTVLDMNGAENLIGKGDLLFVKPGDAKPSRGQCSFVSDEEVHNVIEFIKNQQQPVYDESILSQKNASGFGGSNEKDELYDEAVRLVIETNQASVSILQRRMRLGYTRAARLIDLMEQDGLVGPYCGSKPRDLLVDREDWLLKNMKDKEQKEEHA